MFFRPEEELKESAEIYNDIGDLWYNPIGCPFHIDPAGRWRKAPLGEQWRPICLNSPTWILVEFAECYNALDVGRDANEILKDFAYYLFRNMLQDYAVAYELHIGDGPYTVCFVGSEWAIGKAIEGIQPT